MSYMNEPISFKPATTIGAYRIVTANTGTANVVKLAATAAERPIGISKDTVKDTVSGIPIICYGIARLFFGDTIASGRMVAARSDGSGQGVLHVDVTAGSYIVGVLIGADVALTGTIADVLVGVGFKSIP